VEIAILFRQVRRAAPGARRAEEEVSRGHDREARSSWDIGGTADHPVLLGGIYKRDYFPATWVFSDFGPVAIRYYKDVNKNRRLDGKERLSGEMILTTAENEAESQQWNEDKRRVQLFESHGCIHIRPAAMRVFREAGAFEQGMTLVIHQYREPFDDTKYARTP
jgi:hypothetical protein